MDENKWAVFLLGIAVSIIGYFTKGVIKKVSDLSDDAKECSLNHERLRTHLSENYAKKIDVNDGNRQIAETVRRLHERLDQMPKDIVTLLRKE